jgi:hypothetical protein
MANAVFTVWKQLMLGDTAVSGPTLPAVDGSATITNYLIDTADDTPVPATDQDLADITGAALVASGALNNVTVVASGANVVVDADNETLTAVTGDSAEQMIIANNTGTNATSCLMVHFDTFTSGMPVTPNGGDIVIAFHASGIVQF